MLASSELKATDLLHLGIVNNKIDPTMYDFKDKQEMLDEFKWSRDEVEIWQYLANMKRELSCR